MPEDLLNIDGTQGTEAEANQEQQIQQSEPTQSDAIADDLEDKSIDELKALEKQLKTTASKEDNGEADSEADKPKPDEKQDGKPKPEAGQKKDFEKLFADSQTMIGRQSNEIGELRRQLSEVLGKLNPAPPDSQKISDEELAALQIENPRKAAEIIEAERRSEEMRRNELMRVEDEKRSETVRALAPDLVENAPEVLRILKEVDKVPDDQLLHIARNFNRLPPETQYQLNMRAKDQKKIAALEAEIAKLKEVPGKIAAAANKPSSILQKTPSSAPGATRDYSPEELDAMSVEDLKKLEREMKKKG